MRGTKPTARVAMLVLLWLAGAGIDEAAPPPGGNGPPFRLILPAQLDLEPITVVELLGPGFTNPVPFDGVNAPLPMSPVVLREIPDLWRMRLPPGQIGRPFQVGYDIVGANGAADQLSLPLFPGSTMSCRTEAIPPRPLGNNGEIIGGGIRMFMDVTQASRAGAYAGTLTVTVTRL